MEATLPRTKSHPDAVKEQLRNCLSLDSPRSFFLYAGAGSGKTRMLVEALRWVQEEHGSRMRLEGQHVAVITYTNAARDEVIRRLAFDPLVVVQTIHSFAWEELIKGFNTDIKAWLASHLEAEIAELELKQSKGRVGTQAAFDRVRSIESKRKRIASLTDIKRFTYNPNGDNRERDSLNHAEVIKMASGFLMTKPTLQNILISKFPFLLIDESQDTNKELMESVLAVERKHRHRFALGLFGDTMQRIYADGKIDLGRDLPEDWATPKLLMNYRCPIRVIKLINQVRSEVDEHKQVPKLGAIEGHARLFISSSNADRERVEATVRDKMAEVTEDPLWRNAEDVKTLILEHHMAADRMGFVDMFEALYKVGEFRTGLLDGTLPLVRFFSGTVLPLVTAISGGNRFAATAILKRASPLLSSKKLEEASDKKNQNLVGQARDAANHLCSLCANGATPSFLEVLQAAHQSDLLAIPDVLKPFAEPTHEVSLPETVDSPDETDNNGDAGAIRAFLNTPFSQIGSYASYIEDRAQFGTHQGVKGLEFPRVLVIADDSESRGFLFSYEKLFGTKSKTTTDLKNEKEGKETGIDRTRRLFYVTCSRAETSLAVVAYSEQPTAVSGRAVSSGWFESGEITAINN